MINQKSPFFILILAMYSALPAFATDAYLPAVKPLAIYFQVIPSNIITTVSTYFAGFALGMLIWGLLSDRFGRKKTLIIGMLIYTITTIFCSFTNSFHMLEIMRFFQGASDASGVVIAMSMLRDCYEGKKLLQAIASLVMVVLIAPITAPIIGSFIISTTGHWQNIFHFLTCYGVVLLILGFFLEETLDKSQRQTKILKGISQYSMHLKEMGFVSLSLISGALFASIFSFISASSVIFLNYYHTGYFLYCLLFSSNIFSIIFANFLIKNVFSNQPKRILILFGFGSALTGILICILAYFLLDTPYFFTFGIMFITFGLALVSTLIFSIAMNRVQSGFGTASALSSFIKFSLGGLASFLISSYAVHYIVLAVLIQQIVIISIGFLLYMLYANKFVSRTC
jgi:DHA1 family bicyclomycin/chloramphenicol resistance-like MFS transporter